MSPLGALPPSGNPRTFARSLTASSQPIFLSVLVLSLRVTPTLCLGCVLPAANCDCSPLFACGLELEGYDAG